MSKTNGVSPFSKTNLLKFFSSKIYRLTGFQKPRGGADVIGHDGVPGRVGRDIVVDESRLVADLIVYEVSVPDVRRETERVGVVSWSAGTPGAVVQVCAEHDIRNFKHSIMR